MEKAHSTDYGSILKYVKSLNSNEINWDKIKLRFGLSRSQMYYAKKLFEGKVDKSKTKKYKYSNKKLESVDGYNPNPITRTTHMCICRWHYEGDSIQSIAHYLNRPLDIIKDILENCLKTGEYLDWNLDHRVETSEEIESNCKLLQLIAKQAIGSRNEMEAQYKNAGN